MVVFAISGSLKIDLKQHRFLLDGNGKGPYSRWSEHLEQAEFQRTATLKEQYE